MNKAEAGHAASDFAEKSIEPILDIITPGEAKDYRRRVVEAFMAGWACSWTEFEPVMIPERESSRPFVYSKRGNTIFFKAPGPEDAS